LRGTESRLPFVEIEESPLLPGASPARIYYREFGSGPAFIFLHGGWGYSIYPFDRQIEAFGKQFCLIIPDRTGYGRSMRVNEWPVDFHARAAEEVIRMLDALEIDRAIFWGHSDGAVISAMLGIKHPERCRGIILEAFHFFRRKPGSHDFFDRMSRSPDLLGQRVTGTLSSEHGADYWRKLIVLNGLAWLKIDDESTRDGQDLYYGKLGSLRSPTLLIHGDRDPRTEPGELEAALSQSPQIQLHMIAGAGHSPHNEPSFAEETVRVAREFLAKIPD
jgi:pimeloyl-ACP methyl ester carboxylesterase